MKWARSLPDLILDHDDQIAAWVSDRVPHNRGRGFGACRAIGVGLDGVVIAGFVYFNFQPEAGHIEMGLAADCPRWATRRVIHDLLRFPFVICDCQRVTLVTSEDNQKALRVAEATGFRREALLERAYGRDENAVLLRQFREEWEAGKFGLRMQRDADQGTSPAAA